MTAGPDGVADGPRPFALVAAVGLLGTPVGPTAPTAVRAASEDLVFTSDARYHVQPRTSAVRVTVDLRVRTRARTRRPGGSTTTTPSSRSWPGRAASRSTRAVRARPASGSSSGASRTRMLRVDFAQAPVQRQDRDVPTDVLPQGPRWRRDPRPARRRLAGVVPGLGVRHPGRAGQHRHGRLPQGLRGRGRGGQDPGAHHRRRRPDDLPQRQARQAARVLRLPRRRAGPGRSATPRSARRSWAPRPRSTSGPGRTTRRGPSASAAC